MHVCGRVYVCEAFDPEDFDPELEHDTFMASDAAKEHVQVDDEFDPELEHDAVHSAFTAAAAAKGHEQAGNLPRAVHEYALAVSGLQAALRVVALSVERGKVCCDLMLYVMRM